MQKLKLQNDKLKIELKTLNSQLEAALHKQRQAGIEQHRPHFSTNDVEMKQTASKI
jgi:hypothetical protein